MNGKNEGLKREGKGSRGKQVFRNERKRESTSSAVVREKKLNADGVWGRRKSWSGLVRIDVHILSILVIEQWENSSGERGKFKVRAGGADG